jgi:hexulose-6-phosphate isomerase
VCIPWIQGHDPVPADVCDRRAREAVGKLVPRAEKLGVYLNIENIFFSGYLLSPADMIAFVDSFHSPHVRVHFDTGNIMLILFCFRVHWGTRSLAPFTAPALMPSGPSPQRWFSACVWAGGRAA